MSKEHARLAVLLPLDQKEALKELCAAYGTNASEVVRELISQYLAKLESQASLQVPNEKSKGKSPK